MENFSDTLMLRDRFGTTIWHTSDRGGVPHVYCYYPGKEIGYSPSTGKYVLKRVDTLSDCNGWLGMTILYESPEVSEKEKMNDMI